LLTPEGSKAIEQFQPGDLVLARHETGLEYPVRPQKVLEVFRGEAYVVCLHVAGRVIRTTAEHPFWVAGLGWIAAGELKPGQLLSSHDGNWLPVEAVTFTGECVPVYNIRVEEDHTYFVGCDEWGFSVWAHNECLYLKGTQGQQSLTPRPTDTDGLSMFISMDTLKAGNPAARSGDPVQIFDGDKLRLIGFRVDVTEPPPGHRSIRPQKDEDLAAWQAARAPNPPHSLVALLMTAWVGKDKIP
jgi:hypothetical protein